jgi:hypothetical protein
MKTAHASDTETWYELIGHGEPLPLIHGPNLAAGLVGCNGNTLAPTSVTGPRPPSMRGVATCLGSARVRARIIPFCMRITGGTTLIAGNEGPPYARPSVCQRRCHVTRLSYAYLRRAIHWESAVVLGTLG